MSRDGWNLRNEEGDAPVAAERPRPTLVSLHFIRIALRRRLWVCILCAALGLAAAGSFMLLFSLPHQANASLVLTQDATSDGAAAMESNISLLDTRTVANRAIDQLGLAIEPEDFRRSIRVEQLSSEILSLTLTADTDAEAVRRLEVLTQVYLAFRGEQLTLQSKILVDGLRERIRQLQVDVGDLTRQINRLSNSDSDDSANRLSDLIAQRANLQDRIDTLQQSVEDATLRSSAVVTSSRVLDPPEADRGLARRNVVLGLASGLIGGTALGCGSVLFFAITSNRLRQRSDVADALGVPVGVSVGKISAVRRPWRWLPFFRGLDRRRSQERERLAQAFTDQMPHRGPARLAVVGLDNTDELGFALAAAAGRLAAEGRSTTLIDLTQRVSRGILATTWNLGDQGSSPTVLRARGLAPLARHAGDLLRIKEWENDERMPTPELGDAVLLLADFDPAVGVDHLTSWTDTVAVVLTAGRSSVERVRTVGDLIRAAGLDLRLVALLRTERTDDSSGLGVLPAMVAASVPVPARSVVARADDARASDARFDEPPMTDVQAADARAEARARALVRAQARTDAPEPAGARAEGESPTEVATEADRTGRPEVRPQGDRNGRPAAGAESDRNGQHSVGAGEPAARSEAR